MVLGEIKTNTQKRETKDEPQPNGSYKIRQIIIKIIKKRKKVRRKKKEGERGKLYRTAKVQCRGKGL